MTSSTQAQSAPAATTASAENAACQDGPGAARTASQSPQTPSSPSSPSGSSSSDRLRTSAEEGSSSYGTYLQDTSVDQHAHAPYSFGHQSFPAPVDPSSADNIPQDPHTQPLGSSTAASTSTSTFTSTSTATPTADPASPNTTVPATAALVAAAAAATTTTAMSAPALTNQTSSNNSSLTPPALRAPTKPLFIRRWARHASDSQFNAISGAVGGFTSGIITCPLDVIKTKLQAQGGFAAFQDGKRQPGHHRIYKGLVGTARVIWRDEGIRGMYRGLGPIILGYLPTWAVWFTVYNKSKLWMGERYKNSFFINFWSSIVAGASSTLVTNPIWVIKTRLMSQMPSHDRTRFSHLPKGTNTPTSRPTLHTPWHYKSTFDAARKMYTTEGILSFYSGLTPALLGLTHVAVQFPTYEFLRTKFTGGGMGDSAEGKPETPAHWFGVLSATVLSKIMASSLTYPHEVIRTRLQTQRRPAAVTAGEGAAGAAIPPGPPRYSGVIKTFRTILHEEGWHAFYAGLGTNMMRAVPAAAVTMMTYEYMMRTLKQTRVDARHEFGDA